MIGRTNKRAVGREELKLEAAFALTDREHLNISVDDKVEAKRHLSYELTRTPDDLHHHVQRIFLLLSNQDRDNLMGAMLDLFIVLGTKGRDLRERMLTYAKPFLPKVGYDFLLRHLEQGLTERHCMMDVRGSVLSAGFCGEGEIVLRKRREEKGFDGPVQEALSLIEYGQVDEARDVLEKALMANPHDKEVEHELIGIYSSTRDRMGYEAMTMQLHNRQIALSEHWKALGKELGASY